MGVRGTNKIINNLTMTSLTNRNQVVGANIPPMMVDFIEGDLSKIFNGKTEIGFSQIDAFAYNPRSKELIVSNRYDSSHSQSIEDFGSDEVNDYILGYINFPGSTDNMPAGWMPEMMKERTISLRIDGAFTDKNSYDRVHKTLDLLEQNGAPSDYKIVILFGGNTSDTGFFLDNMEATTIRYDNLKNRRLVDY